MNDKLITIENLERFYDDLLGDDIAELSSWIDNLIEDTSTANNSTWSSNKINSELDSRTSNLIKDTTTANNSTWSSSKITSDLASITNNLIKDTTTSSNSTWSSSKINSTINSKTSGLIKDTSTANNSTWSSSKINSEIQAHSGETYYAGDNINIDSENVISAIINLATTADIEALFAPPTPAPADNEIFYTTRSGELWEPYDMYDGGDTLQISGNQLLSNTYQDGHGILRYANNITSLNDGWGNADYEHTTDIMSITLPHSITFIGQIMNWGNSGLNTVNYNGTVAECSEIDMPYFMIYSDFNTREIVCTDGVYNIFGESEY